MRNKIYIDSIAKDLLESWSEENKYIPKIAYNYFEQVKMKVEDFPGICYCSAKTNEFTIEYKADAGLQATNEYATGFAIKIEAKRNLKLNKGYSTSCLLTNPAQKMYDEDPEKIKQVITILCDSYIYANAVLQYNGIIESEEKILAGKDAVWGKDRIIIFREYYKKILATQVSYHKGSMRNISGHFRKYKTGKIVWVDK